MEDTLRGIILDGVKYAVRGDPDGARGGLGDMELRGADIHLMELLLMDDKDGGDTTHKETALTPGSLSNGGEGNPSVSQVNLTSSGGPGGTMGGDMVNPAVSRVSMTIGSLAQSSSSCSSSNRRRPEIRFEDGIQTYDIVKQLLRSFQQEAFERMAFNAVLHRVLNFEAEVRSDDENHPHVLQHILTQVQHLVTCTVHQILLFALHSGLLIHAPLLARPT